MIAKLYGRIDETGVDHLVIDVNGVGYLVQASARTLSALGKTDDFATVFTEMQVSENDMRLIGFATREERDWFRLLTGVQGVGGKVGLAILSAIEPADLALAKPAGANVGDFKPLSLREIAAKAAATGGPITASSGVNAGGQAPGFATQFCDVEVDPETGKVTILRFVAAQDVGRAIHPSYVEGQIQGGVVQGIGWALNEEYIYNAKGQLDNPGFLDYRCPVASDLPMIDAVLVEVPNPTHPYGVKGVGEVCICPPMAAIANAIENAIGLRMTELPMSPPKVLEALSAKG